MSTQRTNHEPASRSPKQARGHLRVLLSQAERVMRDGARLDETSRERLRTAAVEASPLSRALSRRLAQVMSTDALRARQAPREELRGLTDDVMRIAEGERFSRARMSGAYLDAPDALRLWRRVAFGATCVLIIGVLWSTQAPTGDRASPRSGNSALQPLDPRNQLRLLTPFEARDAYVGGTGNSAMTPAGTSAPRDWRTLERFGHGPAGAGTNAIEIFGSANGNVFFIDPSGRTRLRVGFGAPRPAAPSAPESPERN